MVQYGASCLPSALCWLLRALPRARKAVREPHQETRLPERKRLKREPRSRASMAQMERREWMGRRKPRRTLPCRPMVGATRRKALRGWSPCRNPRPRARPSNRQWKAQPAKMVGTQPPPHRCLVPAVMSSCRSIGLPVRLLTGLWPKRNWVRCSVCRLTTRKDTTSWRW